MFVSCTPKKAGSIVFHPRKHPSHSIGDAMDGSRLLGQIREINQVTSFWFVENMDGLVHLGLFRNPSNSGNEGL